ncbi:SDR family oxidoreductase [Antrihabitans cavernicola]|uniref:SDR family oxidoreductase n=1 Tax=Antrihabitans cavernicola TaxID=2495913 RepID=A0A5A7SHV4_9NOCA|nr:SDR family oxidoreductase [Spelaeibacter cavernicola]KAA0023801.1 SDR family oxidoreductase [Spelaeibacter cavernicola]
MSGTLKDKKTLVTGAASGIGRATALAAARDGAQLFLTDINEDGLKETADLAVDVGGTVAYFKALDISDYDAVTEFATEVHSQVESLDVVMNIAGISAWGTVENLEHHHWKSLVDVNLMGPIHVIENFIPPMIKAGKGGNLVNVSSAAGLLALPWHAAYSASKYGLRGVSEVLQFDLKRHHISVHLVVPGAVKTPLVDSFVVVGVDKEDPRVKRYMHEFEKRAISPNTAADAIMKGIEKDRFLVYTSRDIQFGYWWARKFAPPYNWLMQKANDRFSRFLPPA